MMKKLAMHSFGKHGLRSCLIKALCSLLLIAAAIPLPAQELTVQLDPEASRITFTLPASFHTVHGSFQLKSGTVHFNPAAGSLSGAIIADATSAQTGNDSRDKKMHREILESWKYPEVTFTPTKIVGPVSLDGDSTVQIEGIFHLHGDNHPMTLQAAVHVAGETVTAKARFLVPYVAWGLKNPSTFLLHVSDKVQVEVTATGRLLK